MSSRLLLAVAALAVAGCTAQRTAATDTARRDTTRSVTQAGDVTSARQQIEATDKVFVDGFTKGDTTGVVALYANDAELMLAGAKAFKGHKDIANAFAGDLASNKYSNVTLATDDVMAGGDLAVQTGHYAWTITPKKGKPVSDVGKFVTVWQRQPDGSYKIVRDIANSDGTMK